MNFKLLALAPVLFITVSSHDATATEAAKVQQLFCLPEKGSPHFAHWIEFKLDQSDPIHGGTMSIREHYEPMYDGPHDNRGSLSFRELASDEGNRSVEIIGAEGSEMNHFANGRIEFKANVIKFNFATQPFGPRVFGCKDIAESI